MNVKVEPGDGESLGGGGGGRDRDRASSTWRGKKKGRSLEQRAKVSADKPPMIAGGAKFTRFSPMTLTTLCRIQVTASPSTSFPNSCIIDADRFPDATVKDKQQHAAKVSDRLV